MVQRLSKELREFHQFIGAKLDQGGEILSPEEALDEWRELFPEQDSSDERAATIQAVREALADMDSGDRGKPAKDVLADVRNRLSSAGN